MSGRPDYTIANLEIVFLRVAWEWEERDCAFKATMFRGREPQAKPINTAWRKQACESVCQMLFDQYTELIEPATDYGIVVILASCGCGKVCIGTSLVFEY